MTTTTTAFTAIVRDLARMQSITAQTPTAKHAIAYYRTNIGKITSLDQFVGDYRLLSFALNAYGLGDQIKSIALVRKVIEGGVSDPQSLANKLRDPRWKSFAAAFDFKGGPPLAFSQSSRVQMTVQSYVQQKLESDQGAQNAGVQLALYFRRIGPTITNSYEVMGDKNLLKVAQTILGLPASFNAANIDAIAASIKKAMPI